MSEANYTHTTKIAYRDLGFMGYPDYAVGNDGTIWSKKKGRKWWERLCRNGWFQIKGTTSFYGYQVTTLGGISFQISRLVLAAFVGPSPEDKPFCCHGDGNKQNNNVRNLRWGSPSDNEQDKVKHGKSNRGSRQGGSRLTEEQVLEVKRRLASGKRGEIAKIARELGVHYMTIYCIKAGNNWPWLKMEDRSK